MADPEIRLFAELGKMIALHTAAENAIHSLARELSGMSDAKARVVFGGMRTIDINERIRKILEIDQHEPEYIADITGCLAQFRVLSDERDKLVHRSLHYDSGGLVPEGLQSQNFGTAKSLLHAEIRIYSLDILTEMQADLAEISIRLTAALNRLTRIAPAKPHAWRYIPPAQERGNKAPSKFRARPKSQ